MTKQFNNQHPAYLAMLASQQTFPSPQALLDQVKCPDLEELIEDDVPEFSDTTVYYHQFGESLPFPVFHKNNQFYAYTWDFGASLEAFDELEKALQASMIDWYPECEDGEEVDGEYLINGIWLYKTEEALWTKNNSLN